MTNLIITVDDSKKRLKFTGDKIALGERVAVEVVGIDVDAKTRLRVLVGDTTIAIGGVWNGANCELNLFTVQAEKIHCGYGRVVLDDPEANKLYGIGELELLPWPKERGADVPYDLGNYPDVIEDFRNEINEKFTEQDSEIESALRNIEDDNETFKNAQLERQNTFEKTVNANVANKADAAALEEEITVRKNADNALSARINTNKTNIETNAGNISKANTAIEKEVSDRVKAVEAEKQSRLVAEGAIRESISAEIARATAAEAKVESKIIAIVADDVNKSARTIAAEEVAKVVANAPADLDTLKEIADYIESDKTGAAQMVTQIDANAKAISAEAARAQGAEAALGEAIAKKVDAEDGKGLSTEDYTTTEKDKLDGIEAGAQKNVAPVSPSYYGAGKPADAAEVYKRLSSVSFTADEANNRAFAIENGLIPALLPRYQFDSTFVLDGVVTVAPYTNAKLESDGTAFTVSVGEGNDYMRDCVLVVECSNENAPTITWGDNFHPRTDAETDFACVAGKRNVYWISEYESNHFAVAGWQETEGGNAV